MIRPEARAWLARHAELGFAALVALPGLWFLRLGGYFFVPLGLLVLGIALALALFAWRRLRFGGAAGDGPGVVEIREAQIGFFGPADGDGIGGGFVSERELTELRLLTRGPHRFWRLRQEDGQALLIPTDARGADRLFDTFAALPGMDSGALVAALQAPATGADASLGLVIWRRHAALSAGPADDAGA